MVCDYLGNPALTAVEEVYANLIGVVRVRDAQSSSCRSIVVHILRITNNYAEHEMVPKSVIGDDKG